MSLKSQEAGMQTAIHQFKPQVALPRIAGRMHGAFGVAIALIWIHALNVVVFHPQHDASMIEHAALTFAALVGPPFAFLACPHLHRLIQGVAGILGGWIAGSAGVVIHLLKVVDRGVWEGHDLSGVALTGGGVILLVLGAIQITRAIRRIRYRFLLIPLAIPVVSLGLLPIAFATFVAHAPRAVIEPRNLGAVHEDVTFVTRDGLTLHGWYVPSTNGAAVAVIHGSAGSRLGSVEHSRMLVRHGYGVLAFDVRGHGESEGETDALGWRGHLDALAAAQFLAAQPGVSPDRIGLLGLSMGGEIAIEAASHHDGFAAVVADGPSGRTFEDVRDSELPMPVGLLDYGSVLAFQVVVRSLNGDGPPLGLTALAPAVEEPALYIAAGREPAEERLVTKVAERSGGASELWVVDAGHVRGFSTHPEEYEARVVGFFERHLLNFD